VQPDQRSEQGRSDNLNRAAKLAIGSRWASSGVLLGSAFWVNGEYLLESCHNRYASELAGAGSRLIGGTFARRHCGLAAREHAAMQVGD